MAFWGLGQGTLSPYLTPLPFPNFLIDKRIGSSFCDLPYDPTLRYYTRPPYNLPPSYHIALPYPSPRHRLSPQKHCPPAYRYTLPPPARCVRVAADLTATLLIESRSLERGGDGQSPRGLSVFGQ